MTEFPVLYKRQGHYHSWLRCCKVWEILKKWVCTISANWYLHVSALVLQSFLIKKTNKNKKQTFWQTNHSLLRSKPLSQKWRVSSPFMESSHAPTQSNSAAKQTLWFLAPLHLLLSDMWQLAYYQSLHFPQRGGGMWGASKKVKIWV